MDRKNNDDRPIPDVEISTKKPKKNINKKEYLKLLEASEIIYDNYEEIINKGIKINI